VSLIVVSFQELIYLLLTGDVSYHFWFFFAIVTVPALSNSAMGALQSCCTSQHDAGKVQNSDTTSKPFRANSNGGNGQGTLIQSRGLPDDWTDTSFDHVRIT
jgi:hypothetical protein